MGLQKLRLALDHWLERDLVQYFIIAVILLNTVVLALLTIHDLPPALDTVLDTADNVFIAIFVVEVTLKLVARGRRFFKDAWNLFDVAVIAVSLAPGANVLSVLRTLRTLRIARAFRLLHTFPRLRIIVEAMLKAVPSVGWILVMLALVYLVFGVIATEVFGAIPDPAVTTRFGDLLATWRSLFQMMTMEGWPEVASPVLAHMPLALPLFFVPYLFLASYFTVNLFVGIIVSSMETVTNAQAEANDEARENEILVELRALREEVRALREERSAR